MKEALKGIKVLDLTMNLPGPFMTWLMAEMGAEILKLENPQVGDFARVFMDPLKSDYFPIFDAVNRGKKSITSDLKRGQSKERFLQLVQEYNIVVEGFRPGVMEKLGINYDRISRQYPEVIYVSVSGYGQSGSYAKKGGHDLNYQALSGSFDTGVAMENKALSVPAVPIADLGGGSLFALSGLLAAIIQRSQTGKGCHLDVSLYDGAFALNVFAFCQMQRNMVQKRQDGHFLSGTQPFYNIYETSDGRHMSLGALEQKFWISFCKTVQREDLVAKQFGGSKAIQQVVEIFKSKTQTEWTEIFREVDACCEPVLTMVEAIELDLCKERHLMCETGSRTRPPACPIKTVNQVPRNGAQVPSLGEHNSVLDEENSIPREKNGI